MWWDILCLSSVMNRWCCETDRRLLANGSLDERLCHVERKMFCFLSKICGATCMTKEEGQEILITPFKTCSENQQSKPGRKYSFASKIYKRRSSSSDWVTAWYVSQMEYLCYNWMPITRHSSDCNSGGIFSLLQGLIRSDGMSINKKA